MSSDPQQDAWLRRTLRQSPPAPSEACVDAETLAAWADGGLSGQAAAAVELHASGCARCMAVLASMERSAPAAGPPGVWTRGGLLRWLVPLTAAATAVAIWIAVPDRPVAPERAAAVRQDDAGAPVPVPEVQVPAPQASTPAPARDRFEARSAAPAQAPAAPPAAQPETAADAAAGTTMARALSAEAVSVIPLVESVAPGNPQLRWRVVAATSIERSTDGGTTWTSAGPVSADARAKAAVSIAGIRAVDAERAVVRTSDDREFYTANGGLSWTPVQENAKAPF